MYAQLVSFTLKPGMRQTAEKLADQFDPVLKGLKGFKSASYLANDSNGEYATYSLWESKEDAEAAAAVTGPRLEEVLKDIAISGPTRLMYDVYAPGS